MPYLTMEEQDLLDSGGTGLQGRTLGGMHRMHVHPPPPGHVPCEEKMRQWATKKKCKFVYLRLDSFLSRIIIYKKQSFNF
jgi:hypothetical protein